MKIPLFIPVTICAGAFFASLPANAQILYSETFPNTSGDTGNGEPPNQVNQNATIIGWSAYSGATAIDRSSSSVATGVDRVAIAANPGNPAAPRGLMFSNNGADAASNFSFVETGLSLDLSGSNPIDFAWNLGNSSDAMTVRVLVQAGGNWYATDAVFSSPAMTLANFPTQSVSRSFTFSTSASTWRSFTLTPGVEMTLGTVLGSDLPSTTLTGVGFYMDHASTLNTVGRVDTLTITAVPEPSTYALLGAALLVLVALDRRRRRAV